MVIFNSTDKFKNKLNARLTKRCKDLIDFLIKVPRPYLLLVTLIVAHKANCHKTNKKNLSLQKF